MNKAEKYKEQIVKILMETGYNIAVNKETDEPMSCENGCTKCKFYYNKHRSCYILRTEWLNEEHNPYTIPLDTPVDTKVLVSTDGNLWYKRYFSHFSNDERKPYACLYDGVTSWVDTSTFNWEYCKLWSEVEEQRY